MKTSGIARCCFLVATVLSLVVRCPAQATGRTTTAVLKVQLANEQAEGKRLRDEVAKLTEQLAQAKRENEELQKKLAGTDPPPDSPRIPKAIPAGGPPAAGGAIKSLKWPERKLSGLGTVRPIRTKLVSSVAEGAKTIRLIPFAPAAKIKGFATTSNAEASEITFLCKSTRRAVGVLELDGASLVWSWKHISPTSLGADMGVLDFFLKTSIVELRDSSRALARYQAAPESLKLGIKRSASGATRLSFKRPEMVLAAGKVPGGWQANSSEAGTLLFESANGSFQVTMDTEKGTIAARWMSPASAQTKEIDQEISDWKKDNAELQRTLASQNARTKAEYTAQIKTNEARIQKLQAKKTEAIAMEAKKKKTRVDVSGCSAHIVLPNGVVLYRAELVNAQ